MEEHNFYKKFSGDFLSGEFNQFIFSGNIYDIYETEEGYLNFSDFLKKKLGATGLLLHLLSLMVSNL